MIRTHLGSHFGWSANSKTRQECLSSNKLQQNLKRSVVMSKSYFAYFGKLEYRYIIQSSLRGSKRMKI